MKKSFVLIFLLLTACTDTRMASVGAIGREADITCYSGGVQIFKGSSTGNIKAIPNLDGYEFNDKETGKFIRVSGDCVIFN